MIAVTLSFSLFIAGLNCYVQFNTELGLRFLCFKVNILAAIYLQQFTLQRLFQSPVSPDAEVIQPEDLVL